MTIKEVSASYGRKMTDGNYGSRDVFFSITAEVGPDDVPAEVQRALFASCEDLAKEQFTRGTEANALQEAINTVTQSPQKKFKFIDTPAGERWLTAKAEETEERGAENGPRGSKFEG